MRLRLFTLNLVIFILALHQPIQADEVEDIMASIKAADIFDINEHLSSPEMQGRLAGAEGYNKAANWVRAKFEEWGLDPVYDDEFFQPFELSYNETHDAAFSIILPDTEGEGEGKTLELAMYEEFCPTLYSGFGESESEVVFAGFGISAPELGWDDYKNVAVRGKVVAIIEGVPRLNGKDFSTYRPRPYKLQNAKAHEAAGLILLNMAVISGSGTYQEGLPMVMVGDEVAEMLFQPRGYDYQTTKTLLHDGMPVSFATGVHARLKVVGVHHAKATTYNVVGMLEGSDPLLKEEFVVFGAHLDGIGPWPRLQPGASDNASGSAVVLKLAQAFSRLEKRPKRSIVFALFSGEELGLLGSKHMVANLPEFPSKPVIMLNHDVNGVGNGIQINGGKDHPALYELIAQVNKKYAINPNLIAGEMGEGFGNSDYGPFLEKGIPAYATWVTGAAPYGMHTPEDSIHIITPKIMEDVARLYFMAVYFYADAAAGK